MVEKEKWEHAEEEAGINVDRLHDCLALIEKQLDKIYEMSGGRG